MQKPANIIQAGIRTAVKSRTCLKVISRFFNCLIIFRPVVVTGAKMRRLARDYGAVLVGGDFLKKNRRYILCIKRSDDAM